VNDEASKRGDWSAWAAKFTEDAHYVEHAYGEFRGREAIRDWITRVMAPFPHMDFPMDWHIVDEERGWVVFQCQNRLAHPTDPQGAPFQFPTWTLIRYAGDHLWSYEEDNYNPREAGDVIKAWLAAGGRPATPEQVSMK
jgi:ketosteroid isomerase-like protein